VAFAALGVGGGGGPQKTKTPTRVATRAALLLLAPGLAYLALFFLTPFFSLVMLSLRSNAISGAKGFDAGNYIYSLTEFLPQILTSFSYALLATVFALALSYPIAYYIGVKLRDRLFLRGLLLTLVIAPFFISFLLRTFAWKQILSNDSPVVQFFQSIGILGSGEYLLGTPFSVVFGLTTTFIPFMTLPIFATLDRLDLRLLEAGSDLYASPAATFWKVTFPLSLPGVTSGTLLTFIPISGDYVIASRDFLGGSETSMIGNVVEAQFLRILGNEPIAASMSIVLMTVVLVLVGLYVRRSGTEDLL